MTKKEIAKTVPVHLAWSPKSQYPISLAAGTAAQQLDASFSTSACIELYEADLSGPSVDLNVVCAYKSDHRFHKLIWANESDKSIIAGGCDSGVLSIYDANQLAERQVIDDTRLATEEDGLIACLKAHSGAVRALDFTLQKNLLATGASASEIFIWDLNREFVPIQQLAATEHLEDIASLSSNKQVQHIIATAFATQCLVWDLRISKSIIKLSDPSSNIRWKDIKWNPQTGSQYTTQLCLASEEDQYPVIQMWDLRSATSPMKLFQGHERGVLSLDWSDADPDLLMSSGKDNKLLLWNLNTTSSAAAEVIREIPLATEWNFEVNWCPRNPSLISSSSSSGLATVLAWPSDQSQEPTNMIADSFPGASQYQQPAQPAQITSNKAPKWLKKTSGVCFGFGGKLLSFENQSAAVQILQVVTEPNLVEKFKELEQVLEEGDVYAHCMKKHETTDDPEEKNLWNFISGQFYGDNFKQHMYSLLGISKPTLKEKLGALNINNLGSDELPCDPSSNISHIGPAEDIFNTIAAQQDSVSNSTPISKPSPLKIPENNDVESAISDALLLGDLELAVDLCLREDKIADAFVIAMSGGPELIAKAQAKYFEKTEDPLVALISTIATEDWFNIVDTCDLSSWKQILVALLTYTNGGEFRVLCESLGSRLFATEDESLKKNAVICFIFAGNVNKLIEAWQKTKSKLPPDPQELVELGFVMREALKARNIEVPIYGTLSQVLLRYAEVLASEGFLTEAYSYLGESNEESVQELKERLMIALGLKNIQQSVSYGQTNVYSNAQERPRTSTPEPYGARMNSLSSYGNHSKPAINPYNQVTNNRPSPVPPMMATQTPPMFPAPNQIPNSASSTPMSNHNPFAPMSQYPPQPNPAPRSDLFTPPTAPMSQYPLQSNSAPEPKRYDPPTPRMIPANHAPVPRVNSQPSPASYIPPPVATSTQNNFFNPSSGSQYNQFNNTAAIPPSGTAQMLGRTLTPTPPPPQSSQVPYSRQNAENVTQSRTKYVLDPSVKGGGFGNNAPSMAPPITQQPMMNPVPPFANQNPSNFYPQSNQNNFYPPTPQTNMNPYIPNSQAPGSIPPPQRMQSEIPNVLPMQTGADGWNGAPAPPLGAPKQIPDQTAYQFHNQVGHVNPNSTYGSAFPEGNLNNRPPSASNVYQPNTAINSGQHWNQTNHAEGQQAPNHHNNITIMPGGPQKQRIENIPLPKPPLPEQHVIIQNILENLRNLCVDKTANLQMKRKLDDTSRKLETLYDAIRDSRLSAKTLQGLHDIVKAIENGNYPECLSLHTQLVSGPDFSAIASFMPGIKVLVQSAMQLGVNL
ncbi:protein transport protein Sec31A-like [Planococcus citri]|uniref:protein transport protein Sec31A-like n=1 Tax=Planococcus citri TaxID=170843 RepID=UPI0031F77B41